MPHISFKICVSAATWLVLAAPSLACTNILVTKGASTDGSVMITYACDGEFHPHLHHAPAADHAPDATYRLTSWSGQVKGEIPERRHTYAVTGLMNEHQLAISETTFGGREELRNPEGLLHYWELMQLALQRARTAREAVLVITELVDKHGYQSAGESFYFADPNEAWMMEMIGPGKGGQGALWVALRVPDGYVTAHANRARIEGFPLDDPDNCLYSPRVIPFAIEHGYYDPASGKPFRFNQAYDPKKPQTIRYTATRVWSIFRRIAPAREFSSDFHRGLPGAKPYPLWIKVEKKLSVENVMALMRDHYEGTPFDMTRGIDAGPFASPNRWRPMTFKIDGRQYSWERPISTQQTGFSFVSQSRSWLPDAIGGVYWYGLDDTFTCVYMPFYAGGHGVPRSLEVGSLQKFSWDSAWWVFNFVANYANLKYAYMIKDIQKVQREIEERFHALQPVIEKTAATLADTDPDLMGDFLTSYSLSQAEATVRRWRELGEELLTKYNDGYVKDDKGRPKEVGYPESWLREVLRARPEAFLLPAEEQEVETDLPY